MHALHGDVLAGEGAVALLDLGPVLLDGRHQTGHRVQSLQQDVDRERLVGGAETLGERAVHGGDGFTEAS